MHAGAAAVQNVETLPHKNLDIPARLVYYFNVQLIRCVAQLGRALRSGRRGRRFKSCRIDSSLKVPVLGAFLI